MSGRTADAEQRWRGQVAAYPDLAAKVASGKRGLRGAAKEARRRDSAKCAAERVEIARRVEAILDRPLTIADYERCFPGFTGRVQARARAAALQRTLR